MPSSGLVITVEIEHPDWDDSKTLAYAAEVETSDETTGTGTLRCITAGLRHMADQMDEQLPDDYSVTRVVASSTNDEDFDLTD